MRFNGAGITAIVGPNGCGKSNISDAISWVLGEQSAKSLRGVRMADVIFAGTATRKPLGAASVTMTLVDPGYEILPAKPAAGEAGGHNGHAPLTESHEAAGARPTNGHGGHRLREITVTRRLYRSGQSEYLIDGRPARLRDIQDLFMGTGLGPESYAIIEQGRIGQILSSRPADRRAVIEEAAGISKFKAKRRLAEAKLEGARQNLARVFDILEEVGRQVNSLNRQAKKAERFKKLRAEMVVELRRTLAGRFRLLEREATKIALDLNEAAATLRKLNDQVTEREKAQSEAQQALYELEARLRETRQRLAELKVESERTRGRLESQARQIADIELRLTQGETQAKSLEGRTAQLAESIEAHERTLAELEQTVEQARAELAAKSREREQLQAQLRERQQAMEAARKTVLELLGEASRFRSELTQADEFLASIGRDMARAGKERETAEQELQRLAARCAQVDGELQGKRTELAGVVSRRAEVETSLERLKSELGESRRRLESSRSRASQLRARRESLEEILSHRAYTTESVKRFFTAVAAEPGGLEPVGVLADFLDVEPEFEKAVEEFLHDELEYIVVRDWSEASQGIELMRREVEGRATFLVHPEPGLSFGDGAPEPPLGPETGIVTRLSDVLRMTNGLTHAPTELVPRIARCLIAESHEAARRLAQQYPDFYFLLEDGVCYHGYAVSGGKKSKGGPLALKRELREIRTQLARCETELAEAARAVGQLEERLAGMTEQLESLRAGQQQREKDVVALESEVRKLEEERRRAEQRRRVAAAELERLEEARREARRRCEELLSAVAEKERARRAEEEALEKARAEREELDSRTARAAEEHAALRVQLAERDERRRAEQAARQRVEAQKAEIDKARQSLAAEMERLGVERARLLENNIELDRRSNELAEEIAAAEEQAERLSSEETQLRDRLAAFEEELKQLRIQAQEAQERRSQIEVALAERRADLKYLEETCIKELKVTLPELAEAEPEELDEEALADAEERYERLRTRIENLGPVNPAALEEYEEARQRYEFLNAQRQDLLDSIRDTEKAIREIDDETRKRFAHAFEAINENFKYTFRTLFGGGVGEMRLSDPENPNESGIDLVASPPGKRLQNVLLLSGGEKALTALALLMAVFQYHPSPFCVLDEVDAPLDEANIRRMVRLLRDMSAQTQFIVITHAKTTMEAAESLYGVTMQEPGVSKLVSVRLNPPAGAPPPQPRLVAASPA